MLMPGPRMTETPCTRASCARAEPTSATRSRSQDDAMALAVGKQVAGRLPPIPAWSASSGCTRRPWGPSATMIGARPSRSTE